MAEAWNCFHVCVDRFQASVYGCGRGGIWFGIWSVWSSCDHWQDNMLQEMVCRWCAQGVWRDHSFLLCCKTLQTVVKWSRSKVYWLMLERTTATLMGENYSFSDFSFFFWAEQKNQIFHKNMFQDGNQLTEGPSSPLGPLKKEREKKGQITHVSVAAATVQIINMGWNDMRLLHLIVNKMNSIHYCFPLLPISACKSHAHCVVCAHAHWCPIKNDW